MPYKKILADNVILFRRNECISQLEMSLRSDISRGTIGLIERENTNVTLDVLEKLTAYTGLTMAELFTEGFVRNEGQIKIQKENL